MLPLALKLKWGKNKPTIHSLKDIIKAITIVMAFIIIACILFNLLHINKFFIETGIQQ
jgi:hypothetical protein